MGLQHIWLGSPKGFRDRRDEHRFYKEDIYGADLRGLIFLETFAKPILLINLCIFVNSKSSLIRNKLRFRIHSSFDLEQNCWIFKVLFYYVRGVLLIEGFRATVLFMVSILPIGSLFYQAFKNSTTIPRHL